MRFGNLENIIIHSGMAETNGTKLFVSLKQSIKSWWLICLYSIKKIDAYNKDNIRQSMNEFIVMLILRYFIANHLIIEIYDRSVVDFFVRSTIKKMKYI